MAKNTSFKRIWTRTSIRRILRSLNNRNKCDVFLCIISREFKDLWNNPEYKKELIKHAKSFAPNAYKDTDQSDIDYVLFPNFDSRIETDLEIRKRFLEHEIQRLSE